MSISGIQTGVKTSVEVVSFQFSSSSQANGCRNNQGIQFNDQQIQDALSRLSQALNPNGGATNEAQSPDSQEGANPIKNLLEQIVNLLQGLKEKAGNQTPAAQPQNNGDENGGNFLEKLLTAPLDMAKSLIGGIFGGGGDKGGGGGGGGILGGIFGGLFGGK